MVKTPKSRSRVAFLLIGGSVAMLGLSFASVPLYRAFCAATGFGGRPQIAKSAPLEHGAGRRSVRFDANVSRDLPWRFEPENPKIVVATGETATVYYRVTNLSDHETRGIASYNVAPEQAGGYFNKLVCFCFSEQTLAPHQTAEWPVVFFLDPALETDAAMAHVEEITLSYSFYPARSAPNVPRKTSEAGTKPKS